MSLRFHLFPQHTPHQASKLQPYPFFAPPRRPNYRIQCTKKDSSIKNMSDSELAKDLTKEIAKANTLSVQKQKAMKKSREILLSELCRHLGLREDEVKNKWRGIGEEEKWVLVKGFVDEWGVDFHPLSARSVKEMVEECLDEEKPPSLEPSSSGLFPGLKRIIGFA